MYTQSPMPRSDVFFRIIARDGKYRRRNCASSALRLPHNEKWLQGTRSADVIGQPIIGSRQSTPALDAEPYGGDTAPEEEELVVTFPELFRQLEDGVHFGTDPRSCHVLLGHRGTKGISARQCTISIDSELCLWLRDSSTYGTAVECDNQNQNEVRQKHKWILAHSPGAELLFDDITVHTGHLAFGLIFSNHKSPSAKYLEYLQTFATKCKKAEGQAKNESSLIEQLALQSNTTTAAPSDLATPNYKDLYYDRGAIGKGAFGEVRKVVQARSGRFMAAKKFYPLSKKRNRDQEDTKWLLRIRREFDIMDKHSHPNVAQVFEFRESPEPAMFMAYYPLGNISEASFMTEALYMSAFGQILSGLDHLHQNGVVHRDLKPENFLVEMEPFFKVVITDFGLANTMPEKSLLKTFCGTLAYVAPEVFPGTSHGHGQLVDIWSLGVIVLEWVYDSPEKTPYTPNEGRQWVQSWCGKLLLQLHQEDDCALTELLSFMIEPTASKRWSAKQCLRYGLSENRLFKVRDSDGLLSGIHDQSATKKVDDAGDDVRTPTARSRRLSSEATLVLSETTRHDQRTKLSGATPTVGQKPRLHSCPAVTLPHSALEIGHDARLTVSTAAPSGHSPISRPTTRKGNGRAPVAHHTFGQRGRYAVLDRSSN